MNLFLLFQESFNFLPNLENLTKLHGFILLLIGIFSTIVYYKTGMGEKISKGWQDLSGVQDKQLQVGEREIKLLQEQKLKDDKEITRLALQIVDLTREVDVRREINRQDSELIKSLKLEILSGEEAISRLRLEIRNLNGGR